MVETKNVGIVIVMFILVFGIAVVQATHRGSFPSMVEIPFHGPPSHSSQAVGTNVTPTSAPSATPTSSPWKTYTSSQIEQENGFSYSIQYPSQWIPTTSTSSDFDTPILVFAKSAPSEMSDRFSPCLAVYEGTFDTLEQAVSQDTSATVQNSQQTKIGDLTALEQTVLQENEATSTARIYINGGPNATSHTDQENIYKIESCPGTDADTVSHMLQSFQVSH